MPARPPAPARRARLRRARLRRGIAGLAALAAVTLAAAGCSGSADRAAANTGKASSPRPSARATPPPDPASVHANELGQVPVLMVHQVEDPPQGDYAQSREEFRAQLEQLAAQGYVPITAAQLVTDKIDVPAGKSPVVLTFDDGYTNQFTLRADGSVDPNCAVGIMLAVAREHPGFTPVGTMYLNDHPFGATDPRPQLTWLVKHGWEIGNHTLTHANLRSLDAAGVQKEIAEEQQLIIGALPGYQVTTMALPLGAYPHDETLAHLGSYAGTSYDFAGVMLVGANPAPSPYAADWDPYNIPRIRSWHGQIDYDAHYWLPKLTATRYISDGNPDKVSFPKADADKLAARFANVANPY